MSLVPIPNVPQDIVLSPRDLYLGNANLKRSGVKFKLTAHQESEYIRCVMDPNYFIKTYMKIVHVDEGLVPFTMWKFQEEMVDSFVKNRFNVCVLPRQAGKTTCVAGFLLHYVLFNKFKTAAILANKGATAVEILSRVQLAYEHLPKWLQNGVKEWNKGSFELDNGCKIIASATSGGAIRGKSISLLYVDEVAFIPPNIYEEFFQSVYPTVSSGKKTKIVMVSTPKGMNHFYHIVQNARLKKSHFKLLEYDWRCRPDRDEAWKQQEIANTSAETFEQEYECKFLGGSHTLIGYATLSRLNFVEPDYTKFDGYMKIWETPKDKAVYLLSVDVSEGVHLDYSTIQVIDISSMPFKQVATYRSNKISPLLFPGVIHSIGTWYNTAYVLVENNSVGQGVVNDLFNDLEYENVLYIKTEDDVTSRLGMRTTSRSKKVGCLRLKDLVESDTLVVQDETTVNEFYTFNEKKDSYAAEDGMHDDMVMPLVNFAYYSTMPYFMDLTDLSFKDKFRAKREAEIDNDLPPAPFVDDGSTSLNTYGGERDGHLDDAGFRRLMTENPGFMD